ncbi:MAG TPA: hypothetical protein VNQ80_09310 [Parapedobacter sp.]|uniref:hypothetical protein n=1 Tax=Parapedobacter sp. TaxID=1958893 RepID=UPI002CC60FAE|nr:hypothetical protein [Parapedobacter sp.]HWK57524.1 hypothetical protein [Parapedobacter sp.]
MAHQKIYIVDDSSEAPPRAVFDSKEKALQYTNRFKTNRKYVIFEQELNPYFEADPERMPIKIIFGAEGDICIDRGNREQDIELAMANDYILDSGDLYCYTLAKDESEALINAMKIRDRAIEEGDWQ